VELVIDHPVCQLGRGTPAQSLCKNLVRIFRRSRESGPPEALWAEIALQIEKAFGVRMESLLNMQAWRAPTSCVSMKAGRGQTLLTAPPEPR
jgi:hypothetical protein